MTSSDPLQLRGRPLIPGSGPFIFGILNVTPDSFSDGGQYASVSAAVEAACRMADAGADVIDVGGESTRPGSEAVSADDQIARTAEVIEQLSSRFSNGGPAISIDTRLVPVAKAALEAGATIVNDVSALRDDEAMGELIAKHHAGVILMHMQGTPRDMQRDPTYEDVVAEVLTFLKARVEHACQAGIPRSRIVIDPGIGFGKTTAHNLTLIKHVAQLRELGVPTLVGPSRKRFIGEVLDIPEPSARLTGTVAVVAACVLADIECLRVHDVKACRQAADLCAAISHAQ